MKRACHLLLKADDRSLDARGRQTIMADSPTFDGSPTQDWASKSKRSGDFVLHALDMNSAQLLDRMHAWMHEVARLRPAMHALTDLALAAKTQQFRERLADALVGRAADLGGPERELDKLLPEAFAVALEAGARVLGGPVLGALYMQSVSSVAPLHAETLAGMALHRGMIVQLSVDEANSCIPVVLAAYLNALLGKGVHILTLNDRMAVEGLDRVKTLFEFLGVTAGAVFHEQEVKARREAHARDIMFGKSSELVFDHLRDTLRQNIEEKVQSRPLSYAIIEEKAEWLMIKEARTPCMISADDAEGNPYMLAGITHAQFLRLYGKLAGKTDASITLSDRIRFTDSYNVAVLRIERAGNCE